MREVHLRFIEGVIADGGVRGVEWRRDLNTDADTCELLPGTRHTHLSKGVPHPARSQRGGKGWGAGRRAEGGAGGAGGGREGGASGVVTL